MIRIENLSFRYKKNSPEVLNDITLKIGKGERILIAGKNGAGKTTLSKIVSGLIPRVEHGIIEGQYDYKNQPASEYSPKEFVKEIAILFQDFEAQIVSTIVREEIVFYPMNTGVPYQEAIYRAKQLCSDFHADPIFDREISGLSGGEKQKTALLSLLSASPEMLILDEPFTDIDPASQKFILGFLNSSKFEGGIILFEQSLDYASFFDRIVILCDGKIIYDGSREIIAGKKLLSEAGLETRGIYKVIDSGYIGDRDEIIRYIRNNYVFDDRAYETIVSDTKNPNENIAEVKSLSFRYKESMKDSLRNIDLEIGKGDFITVLGANGSGKTTLMKLIAGILDIGDGDILYQGRSIGKYPVFGQIGYVYQNPDNQIFAETVYDEIAFILRMKGIGENDIQPKVSHVLSLMGLSDKIQADPFSLSKGDRQKIACASIIVGEPELIILDEPTTGLDYPSLKGLMKSVEELGRQGKTVIIITHSMETAANYGNRIMLFRDGEVIYFSDPRQLFYDDALLEAGRIERTEIMDISLLLNGRLLLNEHEFSRCWKKDERVLLSEKRYFSS